MVENGIKPVYVFDGKPPTMKAGELEKRKIKRDDAQAALDTAKEGGNMEEVDKQSKRLVKAGLAIKKPTQKNPPKKTHPKNPPKKTHPKNPPKNPLNMFFWGFLKF
jgi:5'-3' exonuclease